MFILDNIEHLNIDFISDNIEDIKEKYIRRGPASRIKTSVKPVKLYVKCRNNKMCYRTYYVGTDKYKKYSKIEKEQSRTPDMFSYAKTYVSEIKPKLKEVTLTGWKRKYLGEKFTDDYASLSGNEFRVRNALVRKGIASEISKRIFSRVNNLTRTEFIDGTSITSKFSIAKNGNFSIKTITENKNLKKDKELNYKNEISGQITISRDNLGIKRRNMIIKNMKNYSVDDFSSFLSHVQYKFGQITANINNMSKKATGILLINGFGDNLKASKKLKDIIKNSIIYSFRKGKKKRSLLKRLEKAETLTDVMNVVVKHGLVNNGKLLDKIAEHVKKTKKILKFSVLKEKTHRIKNKNTFIQYKSLEDVPNTPSINTFHSLLLQRSLTNDYHRGFIPKKYLKLLYR